MITQEIIFLGNNIDLYGMEGFVKTSTGSELIPGSLEVQVRVS